MPSTIDRPELFGRDLRYLSTHHLFAVGTPQTVEQLVEAVRRIGYGLRGRSAKTVSDALRADLRHRRVVRSERGTYVAGRMPRQTRAWRAAQVRRLVEWVDSAPTA